MRWRYLWTIVACLASAAPAATTIRGDLERRADLGFRLAEEAAAVKVTQLDPASPAARAGLREADLIVGVDGRRFARGYEGLALLQRLRGAHPASLTVRRDGQVIALSFVPPPRPLEQDPAREIEYDSLTTTDGARLRTILSRPVGARGRLPVLFLTQWVSCGPLEGPAVDQLRALAAGAGMALMRVERSGAGDSLGPACHELDFDTEVAHYRQALDRLLRHAWIDPERVVIYGNSLGAITAPLVARGHRVAGILVQGGGALTYVERMIHFDRLFLERSGVAPAEIDRRMRESIAFHTEYLLRGRTPEQIARERPELASVWSRLRGTGDGVHYGRPYAWHQQAAAKDLLAAWTAIEAPVLVVYGEYDQFETRHGHRLIVDTINRLRPGTAEYLEIAHADHELEIYPSAADAYAYRGGRPEPALFLEPAVAWLRRVTAPAGR